MRDCLSSAVSTIFSFVVPATGLTGYVLEPKGPSTKIANQNQRIPEGTYNLTPNTHNYPGDYMLYNSNVPAGRGITMHSGNHPGNTKGCPLSGSSWGGSVKYGRNWVGSSVITKNTINQYINNVGYRRVSVNVFDLF